jgi:hypothetical protein
MQIWSSPLMVTEGLAVARQDDRTGAGPASGEDLSGTLERRPGIDDGPSPTGRVAEGRPQSGSGTQSSGSRHHCAYVLSPACSASVM